MVPGGTPVFNILLAAELFEYTFVAGGAPSENKQVISSDNTFFEV